MLICIISLYNITRSGYPGTMNISTAYPENHTAIHVRPVADSAHLRNQLLGGLGIPLNVAAVVMFWLSGRIRPSLKLALISMSLTDMFLMTVAAVWSPQLPCWPALYFVASSVLVSYFLTTVLALHNYVAVFYPMHCQQIWSVGRSLIAVASCWLGGHLISLACLGVHIPRGSGCYVVVIMPRRGIIIESSICLLCCFLIIVLNVRVLIRIRRRSQQTAMSVHSATRVDDQTATNAVEDISCINEGDCPGPTRTGSLANFPHYPSPTISRLRHIGISLSQPALEDLNSHNDYYLNLSESKTLSLSRSYKYSRDSYRHDNLSRETSRSSESVIMFPVEAVIHTSQDPIPDRNVSLPSMDAVNAAFSFEDAENPFEGSTRLKTQQGFVAILPLEEIPKRTNRDEIFSSESAESKNIIVSRAKRSRLNRSADVHVEIRDGVQDNLVKMDRLRETQVQSAESFENTDAISDQSVLSCASDSTRSSSRNFKVFSVSKQISNPNPSIDNAVFSTRQDTNAQQKGKVKEHRFKQHRSSSKQLQNKRSEVASIQKMATNRYRSTFSQNNSGKRQGESVDKDCIEHECDSISLKDYQSSTLESRLAKMEYKDGIRPQGTTCFTIDSVAKGKHFGVDDLESSEIGVSAIRSYKSSISEKEEFSGADNLGRPGSDISAVFHRTAGDISATGQSTGDILTGMKPSPAIGARRPTPRIFSSGPKTRSHRRSWRHRTQNTLLMLSSWCCFLSLPYVIFGGYVAIWIEDRESFINSGLGFIISSLVALGAITNPLLYAWRFVEWRAIWKTWRRYLRRATS